MRSIHRSSGNSPGHGMPHGGDGQVTGDVLSDGAISSQSAAAAAPPTKSRKMRNMNVSHLSAATKRNRSCGNRCI